MKKFKIIAGIIFGIIFLISAIIAYVSKDVVFDDANMIQKASTFIVVILILGLLLRGCYWLFFGGKK